VCPVPCAGREGVVEQPLPARSNPLHPSGCPDKPLPRPQGHDRRRRSRPHAPHVGPARGRAPELPDLDAYPGGSGSVQGYAGGEGDALGRDRPGGYTGDRTVQVPHCPNRTVAHCLPQHTVGRYTLRHTDEDGGELRNWHLEGSCVGVGETATWDTLAMHQDDSTLTGRACQGSFKMSLKPRKAYRYEANPNPDPNPNPNPEPNPEPNPTLKDWQWHPDPN